MIYKVVMPPHPSIPLSPLTLLKLIWYQDSQNVGCSSGPAQGTNLNLSQPVPMGNTCQGNRTEISHSLPAQLYSKFILLKKIRPLSHVFELLLLMLHKTPFCPKSLRIMFHCYEALHSPNSQIVFPWIKDIKLVAKRHCIIFVIWQPSYHWLPSDILLIYFCLLSAHQNLISTKAGNILFTAVSPTTKTLWGTL